MWNVFVADSGLERKAPHALQVLLAAGCHVRLNPLGHALSDRELSRFVKGMDGVLIDLDAAGPEMFAAGLPRLRVLSRLGVGTDNVDIKAATRSGVAVTNTPGANSTGVAELALGLMIISARRILQLTQDPQKATPADLPGSELAGKTLGLIGLGSVGRAVAGRAKAFEMRVLAYDTFWDEEKARSLGVEQGTLDEVLAYSHFISLHVPLTPETHHLIGEAELRGMRKDCILVNTGRGELVDGRALISALSERRIKGAALDVYEQGIAEKQKSLAAHGLVLTPHIGGRTVEGAASVAESAVYSLVAVLRGERPPTIVNPQVFAKNGPAGAQHQR